MSDTLEIDLDDALPANLEIIGIWISNTNAQVIEFFAKLGDTSIQFHLNEPILDTNWRATALEGTTHVLFENEDLKMRYHLRLENPA